MRNSAGNTTILILHNIRSAHNVGSIFRTADAAGVSKIVLSGHTPAPVDRFGRARKDIAKVALGAERTVLFEVRDDVVPAISELKEEGFLIVAVEQDPASVSYKEYVPKGPTAFVFGNEVDGLSKEVRVLADAIVEIPMRGAKESLNVAVAAGIILFCS